MKAAAAGPAFLVALLLVAANLRPSLTGVGPLLAQIKDHYPDRLPLMTTVYATVMGAVAGMASGIGVPLAAVLPGGWRASLALWAIPAALALLLWLPQVLQRRQPAAAAAAGADAAAAPAASPWRSAVAWQVMGHMGMQATMFYIAIAWYPAYLADQGYTPTAAGWLLTIYQIAAFVAGLAIPTLLRRLPDQRLLAFWLAAIGLGSTLGLWLLPQLALPWMVLLGIGAGPSLILSLSFVGLRAGRSAPVRARCRTARDGRLSRRDTGYAMNDPDDRHRLDKWLWCTRFYKTRSLATQAVAGGRVKLNGERAKASRDVKVGDRLSIASGDVAIEVDVMGLPERRGPAPQARGCYEETAASIAARTLHQERQKIAAVLSPRPEGRPDKRDRRRLERFRRDNDGSGD